MIRIFGGPERYIQGEGAFELLAETASGLGGLPLVVIDSDVQAMIGHRLDAQFNGSSNLIIRFSGEVTFEAIEAIAAAGRGAGAGLVIGIGGGKALDAAKGAALRLGLRFMSVPTVASNDSPTSMALAIYDAHHTIAAIERLPRSPTVVLVDTALIAQAPARFLLGGIGDAIAKAFEAERVRADGGRNFHGTQALRTAQSIADGCYATLRAHGAAAMQAASAHSVTESFEAVVEACILMAGLAWENGGLSIAHGVVRGLVASRIGTTSHGQHVAYGLLVQLAFEGRTDGFIRELLGFYRDIGLPCSLGDLGMDRPTMTDTAEIARRSLLGPKGGMLIMPQEPDGLIEALQRVEMMATAVICNSGGLT